MKIAKQKAGSYDASQKKPRTWHCGGSAPFKTEEEPTSSVGVRRARNAGAPAILDNFAPTVWKKEEKL
jgi:hypothetical protein